MEPPLPAELQSGLAVGCALACEMCKNMHDRDDLLAAARYGVWKAWLRFDPSRGIRFTTMAGAYARGEVLHWLRDSPGVPRGAQARGFRPPAITLDEPVPFDEHGRRWVELLPDERPWPGQAERLPDVWLHVEDLPERLRAVIVLRFREGLSQKEVGRRLGYSQMHIHRLQEKALRLLREALTD